MTKFIKIVFIIRCHHFFTINMFYNKQLFFTVKIFVKNIFYKFFFNEFFKYL